MMDQEKKGFHFDKYNKKHLGVLFIIGLLLIVIALPTSNPYDQQESTSQENTDLENTKDDEETESLYSSQDLSYKTQLELQLKTILEFVEGVGQVTVMITLESTAEKIVEKDINILGESQEEETVYDELENGNTPYIIQENYPVIEGIVVVAEGGDQVFVIQNITEAIQALFAVDSHKIKIMKMKLDS